jgi:predicted Zn-dependent protease with MMP-like domain
VLIGGLPAAVAGDSCACMGEPDKITGGTTGVFIGGKPAARVGDSCAHGGVVIGGCGSVLIGERGDMDSGKEPSTEEKVKLINNAIKTAINLLINKLQLLEKNEANTVVEFKKWFGVDDDDAKLKIVDRIRRSLKVCSTLTDSNFLPFYNVDDRDREIARVYSEDNPPIIYLGNAFWTCKEIGKPSRASVIIHELSHLKYIGGTEDVIYGKERCEGLAQGHPRLALKNAESYELFIMS